MRMVIIITRVSKIRTIIIRVIAIIIMLMMITIKLQCCCYY